MGALFSKNKKTVSRVTEQDKAVLQLKQQRDKLKQYQKRIVINIDRDVQLAKRLLKEGKRDRAKLLLKKNKYQKNLLENTDTQLEKLEQLTHDIEFAQIEIQVLDGLKTGNAALKKVHEILNIDEIEKIMDETREGIDKQREIDDMISGQLSEDDEQAVEDELEQLLDVKDELPEVPIDDLPTVTEDEEEKVAKRRQKAKTAAKVAVEA